MSRNSDTTTIGDLIRSIQAEEEEERNKANLAAMEETLSRHTDDRQCIYLAAWGSDPSVGDDADYELMLSPEEVDVVLRTLINMRKKGNDPQS